jgi:GT2 family glycosyltransferase
MDTCKQFSASDVAVVVIHFGKTHEVTRRAIESVSKLNPPPGHIYVVNNGPGPWLQDDVHSDVKILERADNSGYAGAVNIGARAAIEAGSSFVWILNNDVEVDPLSLSHFIGTYRREPDVDIIGSYIMQRDLCWYGGGDFSNRTGRASHVDYGQPLDPSKGSGCATTTWISGCSMFIPISAFEQRGWFDEFLFLYKEELEWQLRFPPVKARIVQLPLVDHLVGTSTGSSDGRLGRVFMSRNGLILATRQRGLRRAGWIGSWILDYVCRPLLRFRWSALHDHLEGATLVRTAPHEVLARL